jgi:TRAP-type C4-dicarboxylate transport system permease small subunit
MQALIRFCAAICQLMTWLSVAIVGLLALPIAYNAAVRALEHPTIWAFEVTLYALIAAGFLANAVSMRSGAHFRVTLLMTLFPSWRRALNAFSLSMTLLFSVIIVGAGAYFVWYSWSNDIHSASLLETPMFIPQLVIPLGGLGLFLQTLVLLLTGEEPESGEHGMTEG